MIGEPWSIWSTHNSDDEANQMVDQVPADLTAGVCKVLAVKADAEQKAREAADVAADVAAERIFQFRWLLLISLIISGIAADRVEIPGDGSAGTEGCDDIVIHSLNISKKAA